MKTVEEKRERQQKNKIETGKEVCAQEDMKGDLTPTTKTKTELE